MRTPDRMTHSRTITVLAVLLSSQLGLTSSCPGQCRCLWKSSKMTAECTAVGATEVPSDVDVATQVLNISHNSLTALRSEEFALAKLLNLQRINVAHNNISHIHSRAFSGLLNLVDIDLSHNRLESVPSNSFPHTLNLMSLSLSHNPIRLLKSEAFSQLRHLTRLDLSSCQISVIESGSLANLPSLERLYLETNRLRVIPEPLQLGSGLHGVSLAGNPWHCDCRLRLLRDWLVETNVPRLYEPVCQSPHRLAGFTITTLSPQELACLPAVSPTSMFVTVREGRNVSLVCRVKAEPGAEMSWSYNGLLVDSHHPRMRVVQQQEGSLGTRSELLITNTSLAENGSFFCSAENKAGRSTANYTVRVEPYRSDTLVMEMKMEHFIAVSVCVITILLLLMVIVTILLVKIARRHLDKDKEDKAVKPVTVSGYKASSMPRSIQMGTGHVMKRAAPDLLSGVSQSHSSSSDGSLVSMETVVTPANSELSDVRDIIRDLGDTDHSQPLIGHSSPAKPSWSVNNPYLHTSAPPGLPYLVYRQRLAVRPDQQYPILSYQFTDQHPALAPLYPGLKQTSLTSDQSARNVNTVAREGQTVKHKARNPTGGGGGNVSTEVAEKTKNTNKISSGNSETAGSNKSNDVISDCDTVNEILSKMEGRNLLREDGNESEGISEELENAFQNLNLSNQGWDEGTQI